MHNNFLVQIARSLSKEGRVFFLKRKKTCFEFTFLLLFVWVWICRKMVTIFALVPDEGRLKNLRNALNVLIYFEHWFWVLWIAGVYILLWGTLIIVWAWNFAGKPLLWLNIGLSKDVRELSWMSHIVIRFWFLLNFLFISGFFDIPASLSISRVFSSGFSGRRKSSCLDIRRPIIKCDYVD